MLEFSIKTVLRDIKDNNNLLNFIVFCKVSTAAADLGVLVYCYYMIYLVIIIQQERKTG